VPPDPSKAQELEKKAAELSQIEKANYKAAGPQLTGTDVIAGIGVLVVLHALTGGTSDGPAEQNAEEIARWNFAESKRLERDSAERTQQYLKDHPNVYSPDRN
jgi:hypothetical protein